MLVGGLWHGANWTFVIWGGYHGLLLAAQLALWGGRRKPLPGGRAVTFSIRYQDIASAYSGTQLRALEAGWRIAVLPATRPALGIDTPEDYARFVRGWRAGEFGA